MGAIAGGKVPQNSGCTDTNDKILLEPDVYCALLKCAFNKAFDRHGSQSDGGILFKQLVNTLGEEPSGAGIRNPPAPNSGELNGNLMSSIEAIKADFLDHYSLLYNLEEYSIKERLEILGKHSPIEESVIPESNADTLSRKGVNPAGDDVAAHNRQEQEPTVSQGVFSMIESLKHKFETLNNRIEALDNEIEAEVGDPSIREWEHSKESVPLRGGKGGFDTDDELCNHIRNLYSHLYRQAKINGQKIDVMRNRLLLLQSHAKVLSRRPNNDTRIAF